MYGKWFLVTFGGIAVVLLLFILTPWAALLAVGIALVIGVMALIGAGFRRATEGGKEPERAHEAQQALRQQAAGRRGGEPVSGEG